MPSGSNLKFSDIFKQAPEIWLRHNAQGSIRVQERQPIIPHNGDLFAPCGESPGSSGVAENGARLSGESLTLVALGERISARLAEKPEQRILVCSANGVDMQRMGALLDRLAASGAVDISLMAAR